MERLPLWITPTLVLEIVAWVPVRVPGQKEEHERPDDRTQYGHQERIDELKADMNGQFARFTS